MVGTACCWKEHENLCHECVKEGVIFVPRGWRRNVHGDGDTDDDEDEETEEVDYYDDYLVEKQAYCNCVCRCTDSSNAYEKIPTIKCGKCERRIGTDCCWNMQERKCHECVKIEFWIEEKGDETEDQWKPFWIRENRNRLKDQMRRHEDYMAKAKCECTCECTERTMNRWGEISAEECRGCEREVGTGCC